jgi:serine phosphatase RsbU (regulator of sigma subunit)
MNTALKIIHDEENEKTNQSELVRKDNVLLFKHYIDGQHRLNEIEESIRYARNIQNALFIREDGFRDIFPESFYFTNAKEQLTGDFAWATRVGQKSIVVVADCTGHGIPGAMMSILGMSLLTQVVLEERCYEPSFILRRIDEKMRVAFGNTGNFRAGFDGMDIAVCCIDHSMQSITFSGAMRPMWIVRNAVINQHRGARYPIGGLRIESSRLFPQITIDYEKGDMLYLFTDGYSDQFGGEHSKKISRGRLKVLAQLIHYYTPAQQKEQLLEFFHFWKGTTPQTDDVTFVGIRL